MSDHYPNAPGVREGSAGGTAEVAAQVVAPLARTLEGRCLQLIEERPRSGEELHAIIEAEAGHSVPLYSVKPRTSQLKAKGLVTDSGERRVSAGGRCRSIVWRATTAEERAVFAAQRAAERREGWR